MKHICPGALSGCTRLKELTLASVVEIGELAFDGCAALQELTLPASVRKIGKNAFRGCAGLEAITLPAALADISSFAFSGVKDVVELTLLGGRLDPAVVTALERVLAPDAVVAAQRLAGQRFARFVIVAA